MQGGGGGGGHRGGLSSSRHRVKTEDSHETEPSPVPLRQQSQTCPAGSLKSSAWKSNAFSVCDTRSATVSRAPWQRCVLASLGPHPQWLRPSARWSTANDSWDSGTSVPEERAMSYTAEEEAHDARRLDS